MRIVLDHNDQEILTDAVFDWWIAAILFGLWAMIRVHTA